MTATATGSLTFESATHKYNLDGRELPSVTTVLHALGIIDFSAVPKDLLDQAASRGTAVHSALHYLDEGDLDHDSVDPAIVGYIVGYERFAAESKFRPELIEHRLHHPAYNFAGTLDRTGIIGGDQVVLDFKTGIAHRGYALQLAAYCLMLNALRVLDNQQPVAYRRIALRLLPDGNFRVHEYTRANYLRDSQIFLSALALFNWKKGRQ